jgi:hypothetical protein
MVVFLLLMVGGHLGKKIYSNLQNFLLDKLTH